MLMIRKMVTAKMKRLILRSRKTNTSRILRAASKSQLRDHTTPPLLEVKRLPQVHLVLLLLRGVVAAGRAGVVAAGRVVAAR
jgi:hypothetical protein